MSARGLKALAPTPFDRDIAMIAIVGGRAHLLWGVATAVLVVSAGAAGPSPARIGVSYSPELDAGFHLLYQAEVRSQFTVWQETQVAHDP